MMGIPHVVDDVGQLAPHGRKLRLIDPRLIDGRHSARFLNQIARHDAIDVGVTIVTEAARRLVSRVLRAVRTPVQVAGQRPRFQRFVQ